ncbi:hypothetical protein Tco_1086724, partial [Tanacetum coccineum]
TLPRGLWVPLLTRGDGCPMTACHVAVLTLQVHVAADMSVRVTRWQKLVATNDCPTPSSNSIIASPSPSLTPLGNSNFLLEETDAFLALDSIPPRIDNEIFDAEGDIFLLEKLLNIDSAKDLPPQKLSNDSEGDILFIENLLEDEPSEAEKSKINPLIKEPSDTFLIGDTEIKFNPLKDIDDLVPIPRRTKNDRVEYKSDAKRGVRIPSDESKVHIEVLSVLWGNRLLFPDGSFPLNRKLAPVDLEFKKVEEIPEVGIRLLFSSDGSLPLSQLFKEQRANNVKRIENKAKTVQVAADMPVRGTRWQEQVAAND